MGTISSPYVLVVDDNEDLLELVSQMLQFSKMRVKSIRNAADVFASLESGSFDVVLMDVFLGTHDGRDLTRQIRNRTSFSTIPVLLYSARIITKESVDNCGANAFMPKPFDMHELVQCLWDLYNLPR